MPHLIRSLLILLLAALSFHGAAEELRIAVASNFATTLQSLREDFEQQHGHRLTLIRGSTGKLYAQILHGAPYDIFLAADVLRPQRLEQDGLVVAGSRYTYAIGKLALWSGEDDPYARLQDGDFGKLALANPRTAPYGKAAVEVLQHLQLYEKYRHRLVFGENIAQAFQFVQSGSATLGLVALSHVNDLGPDYWLPPKNSYTPLQQQLVVLASSDKQAAARLFVRYLQGDAVKKRIRQRGYDTL